MTRMFLGGALALVAGLAIADPPPPAPPTAPGSSILAYYPKAALAAGVDGRAVLLCQQTESVRYAGCQLVSETPTGQGFGEAALAIAAHAAPFGTKVSSSLTGSTPLVLTFRASLPAVTPDVTSSASIDWAHMPTGNDVEELYPQDAKEHHASGRAVLSCTVRPDAKLDCQIIGEGPSGAGFGAAALKLATRFQAKWKMTDGRPVRVGDTVMIPIRFVVPG